jgi:hypothetical protein
MWRLVARLRCQHGQVALEMLSTTTLLLLAALAAWQLALAGWSAVGAANAARTAARAYSRNGDKGGAEQLGKKTLDENGLGTGSSVNISSGALGPGGQAGAHAAVVVKIPLIFPGLASPIPISATADIPRTG